MICENCRERRHEECRGGSWCDCQHQERAREEDGDGDGGSGRPSPEPAEPRMNWLGEG
ncbi:hypothetical protein ACLQ2R_32910 [Streptosporangium sp. DT93]|uniref:hypothetical protein n=1 Tax=Streptosporangium sp. DT93 TaxID=3393428 RepID=UPI003CE906F8